MKQRQGQDVQASFLGSCRFRLFLLDGIPMKFDLDVFLCSLIPCTMHSKRGLLWHPTPPTRRQHPWRWGKQQGLWQLTSCARDDEIEILKVMLVFKQLKEW